MPVWLDELVLGSVDALFALRRFPRPSPARLAACRIVSHRGERDDGTVLENTFEAFDALRGSGVAGIEFDVRWTADLVPVVFHDADLRRLFGDGTRLAGLTRAELARRQPRVPDLHGFVRRYVDEFHLMAEIKHEPYPQPGLQNARLAEALAPALERGRCHVLSLAPAMFAALPAIPARATLGVSRANVEAISAEALARGRAGIAGHYATLNAARIAAHHRAGQVVGCGFPASTNVFCREAARGIDWVFTNRALALQRFVNAARAETPAPPG